MRSTLKNRPMRTVAALAGVVALTLTAAGCASSDTAADPASTSGSGSESAELIQVPAVTVTISGAYWRELVAQELGFFEDHGVDVEYTFARSNTATDALISGSADIGLADATLSINAIQQGAPLQIVGQGVDRQPYYLVASEDITSVEDLKGKTIGVENDVSVYTEMIKELLEDHDVDPAEVNFVYGLASSTDRASALQGGAVNAVLLVPPATATLEAEGYNLVASALDVIPLMTQSATVANSEWAEANPEAVTGYLAALEDAVAWLNDEANREQAVDILAAATEAPVEDADVAYDEYISQRQTFDDDPCVNLDAVDELLTRSYDLGLMQESAPEDVATTEYCG